MADYFPLLERAVSSLPESTPESRRVIYERARKALLGQLRNVQPPVAEADIDRENTALDDAIARLEAGFAQSAPTAAPVVAPAPPEPVRTPEPPGFRAVPQRPAAPVLNRPAGPPRMPPGRPPFTKPSVPPGPPRPPLFGPQATAANLDAPEATKPVADADLTSEAPPATTPATTAAADLMSNRAAETDEKLGGVLKRFGRPRSDDAPSSVETLPAEETPPAADAERRETMRPVAPTVAEPTTSFKRMGILAAVLVIVVAGVAALAFKLRDNPEDFARGPAPAQQEQDAGAGKIVERVGGGQPSRPAAPGQSATQQQPRVQPNPSAASEPAIAIAQRAAILVEAPEDPQKVKTLVGSVLWRVEAASDGSRALVADLDLREAKMKVVMKITRNTDPKLPASHTIELRFTPTEDSDVPGVKAVDTPQMRIEDRPTGESLSGVPAAIMPNFFLIGLTNSENLTARNIELMKTRAWFDIPMLLTNGKIAKLTFEKGTSGDAALTQVLQAWQQ